MRMRAIFGTPVSLLFLIPLPPLTVYLDRRYLRHHFCTFSGPAVDFQVAAKQCHPLTHAGETQTLARPASVGDPLRVEAWPPITHLQANRVVQTLECDPHPGGRSMLVDVGEGLLCDPEERCLDFGRQTPVSQGFLVVDLGALSADLLDLQTNGGRQSVAPAAEPERGLCGPSRSQVSVAWRKPAGAGGLLRPSARDRRAPRKRPFGAPLPGPL